MPWPFRVVVFVGVLLLVAAAVLAAVKWWRFRHVTRSGAELTLLSERIEAMVGEGFRVQEFIESGLIPVDGKPSAGAAERAADFRDRCVVLLREGLPTLLAPFGEAGNAYRRENSGQTTTKDIREAFAGMAWGSLLLDVQANMSGLEAAQKELGRRLDRQPRQNR